MLTYRLKGFSFGILTMCLPPQNNNSFPTTVSPLSPLKTSMLFYFCIKVSNYLLLFSLYCYKYLNLIFNIFIFRVVAVFQPWTGWWCSWSDIIGLYILNIYLTWQHSRVLHLTFGVSFKSVMQNYIREKVEGIALKPRSYFKGQCIVVIGAI